MNTKQGLVISLMIALFLTSAGAQASYNREQYRERKSKEILMKEVQAIRTRKKAPRVTKQIEFEDIEVLQKASMLLQEFDPDLATDVDRIILDLEDKMEV